MSVACRTLFRHGCNVPALQEQQIKYHCVHHAVFAGATGVMFFFGILMSVEALNAAGLLSQLAEALAEAVPNVDVIAG